MSPARAGGSHGNRTRAGAVVAGVRAIQYSIALPDDYDMGRIEDRVRAKAHLFSSVPGLELKAFLCASRADGAPSNVYAPLYVWRHATGLVDFLSGPLFGSVIGSFGRPALLDRQVLEFGVAARGEMPRVATFESFAAGPAAQPAGICHGERWAHRKALACPGLYAACSTLDTVSWSVTRIRFWPDARAVRDVGAGAHRLRVLAVVGQGVAPGLTAMTAS